MVTRSDWQRLKMIRKLRAMAGRERSAIVKLVLLAAADAYERYE